MNHFARRCRERGIETSCPYRISIELRKAAAGQENRLEMAEKVMITPAGDAEIWRFSVDEGIFYAVMSFDGDPKTVLTQAMVKKKKWARKMKRRGHVRPGMKRRGMSR